MPPRLYHIKIYINESNTPKIKGRISNLINNRGRT